MTMGILQGIKILLFVALYISCLNYLRNVYRSKEKTFIDVIISVVLIDAITSAVFRLFWQI